MHTYFAAAVAVLCSFAVLDGVWLGATGTRFYRKQLGHLMAPRMVWLPAVLFYVCYAAAITFLVVRPALFLHWGLGSVAAAGAVLGFSAYGAYDFTNHATLAKWPLVVTAVDLAWGTFATTVASIVAVLVVRGL